MKRKVLELHASNRAEAIATLHMLLQNIKEDPNAVLELNLTINVVNDLEVEV